MKTSPVTAKNIVKRIVLLSRLIDLLTFCNTTFYSKKKIGKPYRSLQKVRGRRTPRAPWKLRYGPRDYLLSSLS
jgi:hypothetical protein